MNTTTPGQFGPTPQGAPGLNPVSANPTPPPLQWSQVQTQLTQDFKQADSTSLSWEIKGLKSIFEQTRGEAKSRVIKSALFGGGRWQILWYPNAGGPVGSEWTSLYLSAEPIKSEYEDQPPFPNRPSASDSAKTEEGPRFQRKGVFSFKFSITAGEKLICVKEDAGHTFAEATSNWGWANFVKRDSLYFENGLTKRLDVLTISCTVTSAPGPPRLPDPVPHQLVPQDLIDVVGRLLDKESYSDVEFYIPPRANPSGRPAGEGRTIWANRTMLSRQEYFDTMLSSGFSEDLQSGVAGLELSEEDQGASLSSELPDLEDSDRSDGDSSDDEDEDDDDEHFLSTSSPQLSASRSTSSVASTREDQPILTTDAEGPGRDATPVPLDRKPHVGEVAPPVSTTGNERQSGRAPSHGASHDGPRKTRVVIRDASYSTYYALLFFIYTETITFAPLTSSFLHQTSSLTPTFHSSHQYTSSTSTYRSVASTQPSERWSPRKARREWIDEWCQLHPGRPRPPSAKSIYILADKMGLGVLKKKAFDHIVENLTVEVIAHEAFSNFSAAFEEVRKVQVDFFLENWRQIKETTAMQDIWGELRSGRHLGFEDVWPLIISQLEFVPRAPSVVIEEREPLRFNLGGAP